MVAEPHEISGGGGERLPSPHPCHPSLLPFVGPSTLTTREPSGAPAADREGATAAGHLGGWAESGGSSGAGEPWWRGVRRGPPPREPVQEDCASQLDPELPGQGGGRQPEVPRPAAGPLQGASRGPCGKPVVRPVAARPLRHRVGAGRGRRGGRESRRGCGAVAAAVARAQARRGLESGFAGQR